MTRELKKHLLPLLGIFLLVSIFWLIKGTAWYDYVYMFFGFIWGAFLLDFDHIIFWLYLRPNLEESRLGQIAIKKRDYLSALKLLESTHHRHTELIFHHYFFQVVLALISFFVFSSTNSVFARSLILALNIHLLVDEYDDFRKNPKHLQEWLFARESKQLSVSSLPYYLGIFAVLCLLFIFLLIRF